MPPEDQANAANTSPSDQPLTKPEADANTIEDHAAEDRAAAVTTPTADTAAQAAGADPVAEPVPAKPPKKLRWWTIITLPVIALISSVGLWLGGDVMLDSAVRGAIEARHLELGPATALETTLIGGKVALVDADIVARNETQTQSIFQSPRTAIDVAVWETLASPNIVIDEISIADARVNLRRWPDGSVPGPQPTDQEIPPDQPVEEQDPPRDWVETYERARVWYDRANDWMGSDESDQDTQGETVEQPVQPAPGWEQAERFYPTPAPGEPLTFPRTVIRTLNIGGSELRLPDATGPDGSAPLDFSSFSLTGSNVALRPHANEVMTLALEFITVAAGSGQLALQRSIGDGSLSISWGGVPLAVIAAPEVAGERIAQWQPQGMAELELSASWLTAESQEHSSLHGTIGVTCTDLQLQPTAAAGPEASQVTQALEQLRSLHQQLAPDQPMVLRWALTLGGTAQQPVIEDLGVSSLVTAIRDQITELTKQKVAGLTNQATEQITTTGQAALDKLQQGDVDGALDGVINAGEGTGDQLDTVDEAKDTLKGLFGR